MMGRVVAGGLKRQDHTQSRLRSPGVGRWAAPPLRMPDGMYMVMGAASEEHLH